MGEFSTLVNPGRHIPAAATAVNGITDVAAHFGLQTEGAHRALFDCMMNQGCYEEMGKLMEKMKKEGADEGEQSCPVCGGVLVLRKGKFGMFYGCSGYPGCRYTRNAR